MYFMLKTLQNFPIVFKIKHLQDPKRSEAAYFFSFIFPKHPCVSHLPVCLLIHSPPLLHFRVSLLAGFQ